MLNFLRKLRRKEMKGSRYLKYAVGEIFLVMIGILLAVQINNWNEARKAQTKEVALVEKLLEDTRADSAFFNTRKTILEKQIYNYNTILMAGAKTLPDSLAKSFKSKGLLFSSLAYQSNLLFNNPNAFNLLNTHELKRKLREYSSMYEYVSVSIMKNNQRTLDFGDLVKTKYYDESALKALEGVDIEELRFLYENKENLGSISLLEDSNNDTLKQVDRFLPLTYELMALLEAYLKKHN